MSDSGGLVLQGDDGSLYFIRDEVLAASKLEGDYLENAKPLIEAEAPEVEGFALQVTRGGFTPVGQFTAPVGLKPGITKPDLGSIESTIMCPW